jgi:hypothetical protein
MMVPTLILVVLAAFALLVGLTGLVLLVVGIIKRSAPMWVCGIIGICLAALAPLAGAGAGLVIYLHGRSAHVPRSALMGPGGGGDYVRFSDERAVARVEGVEFEVLRPGSGGARSSSRTKSAILPGASETRHEIRLGEVEIVVERRNHRLTFSVNGTNYGTIHRGDCVLVNETREVLVNDQRRLP